MIPFLPHLRLFPACGQRLIRLVVESATVVTLCLLPVTISAEKSIAGNPVNLGIDNRFGEYSPSSANPDKSPDEVPGDYSYCGSGLCSDALESNTYCDASAAIVYNGHLIVGGYFTTADGQPVSHIARWDGSAWHDFEGGVSSETTTWGVLSLCIYNGELIAGGRFDHAGGIPAEGIAAWDGMSWHPLGEGLSPDFAVVYDMCVYDGQLIVAGNFPTAGGVEVHDLAAWDGTSWYDLPGLESDNGMMISSLCVYDGKLITSGSFDYPEGRIAAWNGVSWSSLGAGLDRDANALIEYNGQLIAGGNFTTAGGEAADAIASWNGSEWSAIGSGVSNEVTGYPGTVICFHIHNGNLIVGGSFSDVDNIRVNHIASWDGTTWSPLGSGMGDDYDNYYNPVYTLTSFGDQLIAGGSFRKISSAPGNRIAGWDGSSWSELSAGGIPFAFMIETVAPYQGVPYGEPVSVEVTKVGGTEDMYGFDLLIGYEAEALTLTGVTPGPLFDIPGDFEWDYFEYRDGEFEGCNGDCPSGLVRIVGIAELNDGSGPASSFDIPNGTPAFTLNFMTTEDTTINCRYTLLEFFWLDCGDNTVALEGGDLGVSDGIWRYGHFVWENIADPAEELPSGLGAPESCLSLGENPPTRFVDLINSAVLMYCNSDPFDWRGDINLNGISNEIADWVMFTSYFLYGFQAFSYNLEASIAASDINADGITLSVEDLVYLNRIICAGGSSPMSTTSNKMAETNSLVLIQDLSARTVSFDYDDTLAAVFLVFKGDIVPEFVVDTSHFRCAYWYNGEFTCVLIQPTLDFGVNRTGFTAGPLFTYTGFGRLEPFDSRNARITGAADFHDNFFTMMPNSTTTILITGDNNGWATVDPHPVPKSLTRIGQDETVAISIGNFDEHGIEDVDLASLRVNDTIVPLSTSLIPPHIVVPARSFINSYYFGPDTLGLPPEWAEVFDTLSTRFFVFSVSGDFTDASSFISLGDATIFNEPATIHVPSGWSTIGAAVEAAESKDTVEVGDGIYLGDGNRDISLSGKSLAIQSTNGPEATTINCGGSESEPHRAFVSSVEEESGSLIEGFNIIYGYHENGGAISLIHSDLTIRNCVLQLNESNRGGALYIQSASPTIENCLFFHNRAEEGGAINCWSSSDPTVRNCTFSDNTGTQNGAALYCYNSSPFLENTLMAYNNEGGAVYLFLGGSNPQFVCCDIYGNDGGNWTGGIADQLGINGNFSEDPLFCDTTFIDFHIDGKSPCSATNNSCLTLIGLYDVGCGIRCGDINYDGAVNIGDPVYLIAYIFRDGPEPVDFWASDLNGDLELDIGDAVLIINLIFRDGPPLDCINK